METNTDRTRDLGIEMERTHVNEMKDGMEKTLSVYAKKDTEADAGGRTIRVESQRILKGEGRGTISQGPACGQHLVHTDSSCGWRLGDRPP